MLNRECWHTRRKRRKVVCVWGVVVVGKYMGGWGTCGGCVGGDGEKFHAARKGGQRKKERRKERNKLRLQTRIK